MSSDTQCDTLHTIRKIDFFSNSLRIHKKLEDKNCDIITKSKKSEEAGKTYSYSTIENQCHSNICCYVLELTF